MGRKDRLYIPLFFNLVFLSIFFIILMSTPANAACNMDCCNLAILPLPHCINTCPSSYCDGFYACHFLTCKLQLDPSNACATLWVEQKCAASFCSHLTPCTRVIGECENGKCTFRYEADDNCGRCPEGQTCQNGVCKPPTPPPSPTCTCTSWSGWTAQGCNGSSDGVTCSSSEMRYTRTRTCTPSGCDKESETKCEYDTTCASGGGYPPSPPPPPPQPSPPACYSDADCYDGNPCTYDYCINPGTSEAYCSHTSAPTSSYCRSPGPWEQDPINPCRERRATYHCSAGSCVFYQYEYRDRPCGYACPSGVCSGNGFCYSYLGSQTNCPYLNCNSPWEGIKDGYKRVWINSNCGRSGLYAINPSKQDYPNSVCSLSSCTQTTTYTTIRGSWQSIELPLPPEQYTYKAGDTMEIKIKGITATAGFTPLLECQLTKTNRNNEAVGGVIFNTWVSGPFPKDVTFSYKIKPNCEFCEKYHGATCSQCVGSDLQTKACWTCSGGDSIAQQYCSEGCDPSGNWSVDYCDLLTDFRQNKGWSLKNDYTLASQVHCVSTLMVSK